VNVADVLVAEGEGYRGSWLIKGDALLSIDLSQAKVVTINNQLRTATIHLPQPKVSSPRVDFTRSKTWDVEKVTWIPWGGDQGVLRDLAMLHAQQLVEFAAGTEENMEHARTSTSRVVGSIYRMVDWDVTIEWEEVPKRSTPPPPANGATSQTSFLNGAGPKEVDHLPRRLAPDDSDGGHKVTVAAGLAVSARRYQPGRRTVTSSLRRCDQRKNALAVAVA